MASSFAARVAVTAAFGMPAAMLCAWPRLAYAASVDGAALAAWWGVPFACMLLSIAMLPLLAPALWHHHLGKIAAGWALALLVPFALRFGPAAAFSTLMHALLEEYLPCIVLIATL